MNYADVYEFSLDWQMGYIEKETLTDQFKDYGWVFEEFKPFAEKYGYFVKSMEILKEL